MGLLRTLKIEAEWEKACAFDSSLFFLLLCWLHRADVILSHVLAKTEPEEAPAILSQFPGSTEGLPVDQACL